VLSVIELNKKQLSVIELNKKQLSVIELNKKQLVPFHIHLLIRLVCLENKLNY